MGLKMKQKTSGNIDSYKVHIMLKGYSQVERRVDYQKNLCTSCKHYNKRCPFTPIDFTRFWMNSLVVVNGDQWWSNEFTSLMNGD